MTNVTILQNNKMQNTFAAFLARQGGWQTYEMCSILPDCKRWAQFDAYIQYMHYTDQYDIYAIYANMTFMLHAIALTKKICQESLKLSSNSNCTSLALRLASEGIYDYFRTLAPSLLFLLHFVLAGRFPLPLWQSWDLSKILHDHIFRPESYTLILVVFFVGIDLAV